MFGSNMKGTYEWKTEKAGERGLKVDLKPPFQMRYCNIIDEEIDASCNAHIA